MLSIPPYLPSSPHTFGIRPGSAYAFNLGEKRPDLSRHSRVNVKHTAVLAVVNETPLAYEVCYAFNLGHTAVLPALPASNPREEAGHPGPKGPDFRLETPRARQRDLPTRR
jgi:hypothetical protein